MPLPCRAAAAAVATVVAAAGVVLCRAAVFRTSKLVKGLDVKKRKIMKGRVSMAGKGRRTEKSKVLVIKSLRALTISS